MRRLYVSWHDSLARGGKEGRGKEEERKEEEAKVKEKEKEKKKRKGQVCAFAVREKRGKINAWPQ